MNQLFVGNTLPLFERVFADLEAQQVAILLVRDISLNMALPCRISVYPDAGKALIGMIPSSEMLQSISSDLGLVATAQQVDVFTSAMIKQAPLLSERESGEVRQEGAL
jgi:hypothetical protein